MKNAAIWIWNAWLDFTGPKLWTEHYDATQKKMVLRRRVQGRWEFRDMTDEEFYRFEQSSAW